MKDEWIDSSIERDSPSRGLGDTVSKILRGKVRECNSCKKRKEMLNKLVPYKKRKK
tara:strand:+ start:728 stop:895 length:168 start_codon:yes stop_codon:yes gene_type:complete